MPPASSSPAAGRARRRGRSPPSAPDRPIRSSSTSSKSAARATAEASGGSPFYIRNRIRDALGAADLGPAAEVTHAGAPVAVHRTELRPFDGDPNRARLGPFADLVLGVTTTPDLPGRLLELSADTPGDGPGYHERLTLLPEACS